MYREIKTQDSLLVGDEVASMGSRIMTFRYVTLITKNFCVLHIQSDTTIFQLAVQ